MTVEIASDANLVVPIPYHMQPEQLVLDPPAKGSNLEEEMSRIIKFLDWNNEEEMVHVFLGAVLLYFANAGTLAECLHTSVVWWRG
jgi:hypothetical protein